MIFMARKYKLIREIPNLISIKNFFGNTNYDTLYIKRDGKHFFVSNYKKRNILISLLEQISSNLFRAYSNKNNRKFIRILCTQIVPSCMVRGEIPPYLTRRFSRKDLSEMVISIDSELKDLLAA